MFDFKQFCKLYYEVNPRKDITELFARIAGGENGYMSIPILRTFLRQQQKIQNVTEAMCKRIISTYEREQKLIDEGYLSLSGFKEYLLSFENRIYNEDYLSEYQPMDLPLTDYFINSSHNTYLTGHQLKGESSVEMYIQLLLDGCRCVELDCWDGDDGEPIIYHGHTLTTKIKFYDVVVAVGKYSFVSSPYPVILSFENHCSIAQQIRMADICKDVLGDMLVTEFIDDEYPVVLPSPEALRYRIIIKNKKREVDQPRKSIGSQQNLIRSSTTSLWSSSPGSNIDINARRVSSTGNVVATSETCVTPTGQKSYSEGHVENVEEYQLRKARRTDSETGSADSVNEKNETSEEVPQVQKSRANKDFRAVAAGKRKTMDAEEVRQACDPVIKQNRRTTLRDDPNNRSKFALRLTNSLTSRTKFVDLTSSPENTVVESDMEFTKAEHSKSGKNIAQELSDLVNYCHSVPFQTFEYHALRKKCCEMCSFAEGRIEKYMRKDSAAIVNFCKTNILRVFPSGKRIESSNFNPQMCWNHGIQMATLNFQTPDIPMQVNFAKFEQNGKCGYVLKPSVMRGQVKFDPLTTVPIELVEPYKLTITLISGQQLSAEKCSPRVEIEIFGLPADSCKFKSKTIPNNGVDPEWHETFSSKIFLVENAIIRFSVVNDNNGNLLGQFTMPVECIDQGYRHVPLRTAYSEYIPLCTIFVYTKLEEVVPEKHVDLLESLMRPQHSKDSGGKHGDIVKALCFPGE